MLILLVGAGLIYGTKPKIPGHGLIRSGPPVLVCRSNWFHVTFSRKSLTYSVSPVPLREKTRREAPLKKGLLLTKGEGRDILQKSY